MRGSPAEAEAEAEAYLRRLLLPLLPLHLFQRLFQGSQVSNVVLLLISRFNQLNR